MKNNSCVDAITSDSLMVESIVLFLTKTVTNSYAWSGVLPLRPGCNLAIQILAAVLKRWVLVVELMKTEEDRVSALIPVLSYCNFQR